MKLVASGKRRILSFDIENRPLSYWYDGNPTSEITAIGWSFVGSDKVEVRALPEVRPKDMLAEFWEVYSSADLITGHYIRRHDLPILNADLVEYRLPLLPSRETQDTKLDMYRRAGQPATLEYLGEMFGIEVEKFGMSQWMWRGANRLNDPAWIEYAKKRVSSDVVLQIGVREHMLAEGMLKPPSMWHSVPGGSLAEVLAG